MKQEFIEFVKALMEAAPNIVDEMYNENVRHYFEGLSEVKETSKPEITDNGKLILNFLQNEEVKPYKSKDIADRLFVASRKISGGMRKLVTDGFVEKIGENPVSYIITEKGKNYNIEGEKN